MKLLKLGFNIDSQVLMLSPKRINLFLSLRLGRAVKELFIRRLVVIIVML